MPVGVDIQAPGRCRTVPAALLAEAELTALAAVRPEAHWDAFLRIWTAKEAVAKIDGRGLMAPLQQLDTSGLLANASGEVVMAGAHWHVEAITVAAPAALALATERPVTVVLRTLELGPMP
jgi:phosphopantetheinyl transferase